MPENEPETVILPPEDEVGSQGPALGSRTGKSGWPGQRHEDVGWRRLTPEIVRPVLVCPKCHLAQPVRPTPRCEWCGAALDAAAGGLDG